MGYPLIFALSLIEISMSHPSQIGNFCGLVYLPQIAHPFVYCLLYNVLIRRDIGTIIALLYSSFVCYCVPWIFHLPRYKIQKIKCLRCLVRDALFISIEMIDYDALISTGKCISAQSDKNLGLLANASLCQGLEQALMTAHMQSFEQNVPRQQMVHSDAQMEEVSEREIESDSSLVMRKQTHHGNVTVNRGRRSQ